MVNPLFPLVRPLVGEHEAVLYWRDVVYRMECEDVMGLFKKGRVLPVGYHLDGPLQFQAEAWGLWSRIASWNHRVWRVEQLVCRARKRRGNRVYVTAQIGRL